ncbi:MAG: hypothetical protein KC897_00175 [Candidatus Omnitrophica bacterium]|nr:hypothetical protein [Candidatus Omnitrophota bacterium]MCB9722009.1 hypothetical protein [Candidatus Omnitrophota bacterium]
MKKLLITIFAQTLMISVILLTGNRAGADDESLPVPFVRASANGHFYFKMIPESPLDREKGHGICYQVLSEAGDEVLWQTSGWYSNRVYLTHDGQYLVRYGNWPRGHELSENHLAIAFYHRGQLIRSYSTKQLVKDPAQILPSMSHYYWSRRDPEFDTFRYLFKLKTIDNVEYTFDIKSGNIITEQQL